MTEEREPQAPWPFYTQKQASKVLNVAVQFLDGLANNGVPAVKRQGKTGERVWLFERDAIDALAQVIRPE